MSLLDRALNFAKKAYNYVVGDNDNQSVNTAKNNSVKTNTNLPNSAIRPDEEFVGVIGDTVETIKSTNNNNSAKITADKQQLVTQQDINKKISDIDKKCKKFNIKYNECIDNILKNMDFSIEEFNKLSNSQKLKMLNLIESTLSLYIADKYKNDTNVDISALIGQSAKNLELAVNEGGMKNHKEFKNYTKEINAKLVEKLSNAKTDDEKIKIISEARQEVRAHIEEERSVALKKCKTKDEIEKVNYKYDKRLEAVENQNAIKFTAMNGPKEAYLSTYFVDGRNYAKANINSIRLFNEDVKHIAAGSYTHERRMNALQHYHEAGDPISADTFGEAIQYTAQFMNYEALQQYEADAYEFRLKHKDKLPEYITQEHLTYETAAVGSGAILNKNLSSEEKAKFIKTWDEHAQQFNDYDEVRRKCYETITEYIKRHPERKRDIEKFKAEFKEKYGYTPELPKSALKRYESINRESAQHKPDNTISNQNAPLATVQDIEQALTYMSYDEARKQFNKNTDKDFAEAIISNPKLKGHKQYILPYIKSLPNAELSDIMKKCYGEMFLYILRNISPDKAGELYDSSKKNKGYAVRKLGENIVEESRA